MRLPEAESLIKKLEQTRQSSERNQDKMNAQHLRNIAINARQAAELLANDSTLNQAQRAEQAEDEDDNQDLHQHGRLSRAVRLEMMSLTRCKARHGPSRFVRGR